MLKLNDLDIIYKDEFVKSPVDKIVKDIKESNNKKTIVNSSNGTGKSVILKRLENKTISTNNPYIYMTFNIGIFYNDNLDKEFYIHYYEEELCLKILEYIKKYYKFTYEKYFKEYYKLLKNNNEYTYKYINGNIKKIEYLKTKQISIKLINKLKEMLNFKEINLIIDNFDFINNSSELSQNILKEYFDLFNKVVITSNETVFNKDFNILNINYSKDINIVKEILIKRINLYNKNKEYSDFSINIIDDNILKYLINKTNGDLDIIIKLLYYIMTTYKLEKGKISNEEINDLIDYELENNLTLSKIIRKPKLYL